ncbi:hypothetical protein QR680_018785 [Steinernema hermaphroditum]|uniref:Uncharacterized protein n=1 Tax=Steinernema hermaphroditum TaxID=289476 RepID=A0AA39HJX8_9BILA|nr:hypothetical protein QR680_018785 [Steinernema hermaphroditum]
MKSLAGLLSLFFVFVIKTVSAEIPRCNSSWHEHVGKVLYGSVGDLLWFQVIKKSSSYFSPEALEELTAPAGSIDYMYNINYIHELPERMFLIYYQKKMENQTDRAVNYVTIHKFAGRSYAKKVDFANNQVALDEGPLYLNNENAVMVNGTLHTPTGNCYSFDLLDESVKLISTRHCNGTEFPFRRIYNYCTREMKDGIRERGDLLIQSFSGWEIHKKSDGTVVFANNGIPLMCTFSEQKNMTIHGVAHNYEW